jgi:hypothetical protein
MLGWRNNIEDGHCPSPGHYTTIRSSFMIKILRHFSGKPKMRSRQPPTFSASSICIVWGYLPLKYFCWIFPVKEEKGLVKSVWEFSGVTIISAVSLTPRKSFQRCQWHRGNHFSGVIQRCQWHRWNHFGGVNDTAEICHFAITVILAVSMTPLKFEYNRFSRRIRSHMRNGFRPWTRALGGIVWWKNRGSKISYSCSFKDPQ